MSKPEPTPKQIEAIKERHPRGRTMTEAAARKFLDAHTSPHAPPVAIEASAQPGDVITNGSPR